ncbi:hypothetical protein GOBAR_AA39951 [Gossypium barbadense]|uniref:Uncharacterized protein n=1 Tax=Gossypium barbadense TaxID=3634 RepID=A0A2P5VPI4_GOSBA|nr:hypothetical protein GOBAR_AA39951 [Gossypium barbadense]
MVSRETPPRYSTSPKLPSPGKEHISRSSTRFTVYLTAASLSVPLQGSPHSSSCSFTFQLSSFTTPTEIHVYLLKGQQPTMLDIRYACGGYGAGFGGPTGGYSKGGVIRTTVVCKEKGPCFNKKLTCPAKCFTYFRRSGKGYGEGGGGGGCTMDCKKKCSAYC